MEHSGYVDSAKAWALCRISICNLKGLGVMIWAGTRKDGWNVILVCFTRGFIIWIWSERMDGWMDEVE